MRTNIFKLLLLIAVALSLIAAGCGDDDTDTASKSSSGTDAAMKDGASGASGDAMKKDEAMKKDAAMEDEKSGAAMKQKEAGSASGGAMIAANATIATGTVGEYGKILQDAKGHSIYIFTKETGSKSACYDECAKAWPPVLTTGAPKAGSGASDDKLGTTKRSDGTTQVTYDGQPLYFYVGENGKPDQVLCQAVDEFGGVWYIVGADGEPITKS